MYGVVEPPTNRYRTSWGRKWRVRLFQLNELSVERNGVIVVDTPSGFEAKDVVEVETVRRTMDVAESVHVSKAVIVFFEIDVVEEVVGNLDRADVVTAKCFDESVLMCAVGSFDPSFSLW